MNDHYLKSSNNTYQIDGLFRPNDVIIPTTQSDIQQCSDLLLNKLQTPMPRQLLTDQDDEAVVTQESEGAPKPISAKRDSAGKGSDSTYSGTPES